MLTFCVCVWDDRSKSWVEEEGEIFRKGTVLLGPEEMEGEYAGEDLRREVRLLSPNRHLHPAHPAQTPQTHHSTLYPQLLEAMVERPPPRGIIDDFGMDVGGPFEDDPPSPTPSNLSPTPAPPPPRAYVSASASSPSSLPTSPTSPRSGAGRTFPLLRGAT